MHILNKLMNNIKMSVHLLAENFDLLNQTDAAALEFRELMDLDDEIIQVNMDMDKEIMMELDN